MLSRWVASLPAPLHSDHDDYRNWARMTGMVSTPNSGTFIEAQHRLGAPLPAASSDVRLIARNNDQCHYILLRRTDALVPTAFYRACFDAAFQWHAIGLPFALFTALNIVMESILEGPNIAWVAGVANGCAHQAKICIREIGIY